MQLTDHQAILVAIVSGYVLGGAIVAGYVLALHPWVFRKLRHEERARDALAAIVVLTWPTWLPFVMLLEIGRGLVHLARGYAELYRKLWPASESTRMPEARVVRPFGCSSDCSKPGCGGGCSQ